MLGKKNFRLFPFVVKVFICRCVAVVSQIFFAWIVGVILEVEIRTKGKEVATKMEKLNWSCLVYSANGFFPGIKTD